MDPLHPALKYLAATLGMALSGIFFALAAENWRELKPKYVYAAIGSILFTPLGTWIISMFWKPKAIQAEVDGAVVQ